MALEDICIFYNNLLVYLYACDTFEMQFAFMLA